MNTVKGKKILYEIKGSSGAYGIHSYMDWLKCPRRKSFTDARCKDKHPMGGTDRTRIGTMFHAFMDAAENENQLDTTAVQFTHLRGDVLSVDEKERVEAERLFRAWRANYYKTPLGKTIAHEVTIEECPEVTAAMGVPMTARFDRMFMVRGAEEQRAIEKVYGIKNIPVKQQIIQDYKTASGRDQYELDSWTMDFQTIAYPLIAQVKLGLDYIPRFVVSIIYKTKEVGFNHILLPPITEQAKQALFDMLAKAKNIAENHANEINPMYCIGYRQAPCPFYQTGECHRTNKR